MNKVYFLSTILLMNSACTTMNESLQLGAGLGAITGAGAIYTAQKSAGGPSNGEDVALGAGIGLAAGLLTSYIVHRQVEDHRQSFQYEQTEMHFGDLPPSPFIMPSLKSKKGGK